MNRQEEYQAVKEFLRIIYEENYALASAIGRDCCQQIDDYPLDKAIRLLNKQVADLDSIYQEMNLPKEYNAIQGTTSHKIILDIRLGATGEIFVKDFKYGIFKPGPPVLKSVISPVFCPKAGNRLYYEYVWANGLNYGVMEVTDQDGNVVGPYRIIPVPFRGDVVSSVHFDTLAEAIRGALRQICISQCAKVFLSHPAQPAAPLDRT